MEAKDCLSVLTSATVGQTSPTNKLEAHQLKCSSQMQFPCVSTMSMVEQIVLFFHQCNPGGSLHTARL